jgi:predicted metal-dependent hydrolase
MRQTRTANGHIFKRPRAVQMEHLKAEAHAWASTIGVRPRRIQVQAMRKKWASCSTSGTVTFSRDLLRESGAFRNFVIVHEILHLQVPNHGRLFRSLMRAYVPDWEQVAGSRVYRSCGFQKRSTEIIDSKP